MTLHMEETGTPGAQSIIFLHGIGASGWMWWMQTAAFRDYHCLNVDLPGHGKSNQVQWVSLSDTADQIASVIRERATNGLAHVVGLSLGGHIGLLLLEEHTTAVDHAIVSGVTAAPMPNRRLLRPQIWLTSALRKSRWFLNMQARALPLTPDKQAAFIENFLAMSMDTYRRIYEEAVEYQVSPGLRQVNNPTLIVAGSRESKIIIDAVSTIAHLMPNATGRLASGGLGHGWNVEDPALFNATVRAWITGTALPKRLEEAAER